jgi:hypothetical protein
VKKFVFLHYGFEKPTPEIMAAWGKWFESMKDNIIQDPVSSSIGGQPPSPLARCRAHYGI